MIFVAAFLIILRLRNSYSAHTFSPPAIHEHLIHLKSSEWQDISAMKFEIRLGVKETLSVYKT